jgi:hydroxyacylglutathione hydrolase
VGQAEAPQIALFVAEELGNSSFLVVDHDAGEAAVIDPLRDVEQYLSHAEGSHARVTYAMETHVHNDFLSGARELRQETGARIVAGAGSGLRFEFDALNDGDAIRLGRCRLRARRTPGHTPDHVSYLLLDPDDRPRALFSGGALMVGTAARTDLYGPQLAIPLAHEAFRTLHHRLKDLPDDVAVYPTHGGGSFCGAAGTDERSTTMGRERLVNPLLQATEIMQFLARILDQAPYPEYYRRMAPLNMAGAPLLGRRLPSLPSLRPVDVEGLMRNARAAVIDVRDPQEFDRGHIPGSYSVSLDGGSFSAWVGWIVEADRPVVLTGGDAVDRREAQRQLLRIGHDAIAGELGGGIDAWRHSGRPISRYEVAEIDDLVEWIRAGRTLTVVDARDEPEWVHGHLPGAVHVPVPRAAATAKDLAAEVPVAVHCASGFRAAIAASIFEQAGVGGLIHVHGGLGKGTPGGLPLTVPG